MSADNAVSRAEARTNSMIDAAIEGGGVAELNHKNMSVALRIGRRNIKLVGGDGVPTREGTHYYGQLGVPPPAVYPYEQGLVNGKWIVGFDGKKAPCTAQEVGRQMGDDEEGPRLLSL